MLVLCKKEEEYGTGKRTGNAGCKEIIAVLKRDRRTKNHHGAAHADSGNGRNRKDQGDYGKRTGAPGI